MLSIPTLLVFFSFAPLGMLAGVQRDSSAAMVTGALGIPSTYLWLRHVKAVDLSIEKNI